MRRIGLLIGSFGLLCALTVPLSANTVSESGAGSLPATAQDLTGLFPTEIQGSFSLTDPNDVDVFAIDILNAADFSALTIAPGALGVPDTELFLFDSSGRGVYYNDDISGSNTLSCLPSADLANPCPSSAGGLGPAAAGLYYLAITRSANLPWDSLSKYLFSTSFDSTGIYGPDPSAGGLNPVAGWDGGSFTSPDTDLVRYDIQLTGTVPEPAVWQLTLTGVLLLTASKWRFKALRTGRE